MTTYEIKILISRGEEYRVPDTPEEQRILRELKPQKKGSKSSGRCCKIDWANEHGYTDVG